MDILNAFLEMMKGHKALTGTDDQYTITINRNFYDCLVNGGENRFPKREVKTYPNTPQGAEDAMMDFLHERFILFDGVKDPHLGINMGDDYFILSLLHKIWAVFRTEDGDFIEVSLDFPKVYDCARKVQSSLNQV